MGTISRLGRNAAAVAALMALVGCSAISDPRGAEDVLTGTINSAASDRALAALSRGDYPGAERHAVTALKYNPKDASSLLVAGLAYQGMGRYDIARQYFEVIITNQSPGSIMMAGEGGVVMPRTLVEVARANMAAIDKITGRGLPRGNVQESGRPPGSSAVGAPPLPSIDPVRPQVSATALEPISGGGYTPGRISDADGNVSGRFAILKRLLDEGLITPDEYRQRRTANLGALLPYSQPAPGLGLERPIPADDAILTRLRDLGQTLETRAITPAQHAAERNAILEALMPAQPRKLEIPLGPPRDMLEASQAVGRLERLRQSGLASDAEVRKEKDAIERALDTQLASHRVTGGVSGLRAGSIGGTGAAANAALNNAAAKATGWGVALTSAKTEEAARKAWDGIKSKFPEQLGKLDGQVKRVEQGDKGVRWKVIAGPVDSKDAARKLCKTLKLHRQSCDPASL